MADASSRGASARAGCLSPPPPSRPDPHHTTARLAQLMASLRGEAPLVRVRIRVLPHVPRAEPAHPPPHKEQPAPHAKPGEGAGGPGGGAWLSSSGSSAAEAGPTAAGEQHRASSGEGLAGSGSFTIATLSALGSRARAAFATAPASAEEAAGAAGAAAAGLASAAGGSSASSAGADGYQAGAGGGKVSALLNRWALGRGWGRLSRAWTFAWGARVVGGAAGGRPEGNVLMRVCVGAARSVLRFSCRKAAAEEAGLEPCGPGGYGGATWEARGDEGASGSGRGGAAGGRRLVQVGAVQHSREAHLR
jgi:hypothetical protein